MFRNDTHPEKCRFHWLKTVHSGIALGVRVVLGIKRAIDFCGP
jgi:hypothetical protein